MRMRRAVSRRRTRSEIDEMQSSYIDQATVTFPVESELEHEIALLALDESDWLRGMW